MNLGQSDPENHISMQDSLTLTLMGTGSSGGVPRVGNVWGNCDPDEPRNRRRRFSVLIQRARASGTELSKTTVVIDHIFGLDDLRQMAINLRRPIDVWLDSPTRVQVMAAFGYCFHQAPGSSYPAFCTEQVLAPCESFEIDGPAGSVQLNTLIAEHGDINALGIRVADAVYLPDMKRISDTKSIEMLRDVKVLIVDALRHTTHPSHMNLEESLAFIESVKPERAILTNMHGDLDYQSVKSSLPPGVEPGYDGLSITLQPS